MPRVQASSRKYLWFVMVLLIVVVSVVLILAQIQTVAMASPAYAVPQAAIDNNDMLLAWIGSGAMPGQHSASEPGQLVLMDSEGGNIQPVLEVPAQTSRITACGESATSPDQRHFAFFVGKESGTLYMMTGTGALTPLSEDFNALGCVGEKTFQYSPDSRRVAYLSYGPNAAQNEFAEGWLHISETENKTELSSFPGVTAFDMNNDKAAFVRFFTNDKGEADEAGIFMWNGSSDQEVATIYPEESCRFTSAQVSILSDSKLVLITGHRCKSGNTNTSWQFYMVDTANRSATLSMSDFQPSPFVSFAQTNNVIVSPNGSTVLFTVPDGITASTTGMVAVDMANISSDNVILPNNAVMPRLENPPFNFSTNAFPQVSQDGRWLALVTNTANAEAALAVIDLNNTAAAPIVISAGGRGDTISDLVFTPDSRRLVFVGGGDGGDENSLLSINLETGDDSRVRRGRFGPGVIASDNRTMAMLEWRQIEDPDEPLFLTLTLVDIESGEAKPIYEGADVVEGKVANQRFAFPLAWRRN